MIIMYLLLGKKVGFLTGADGEEWVWVMGEHRNDLTIEEILEKEAQHKALALAEKEAEALRLVFVTLIALTEFCRYTLLEHPFFHLLLRIFSSNNFISMKKKKYPNTSISYMHSIVLFKKINMVTIDK